MTQAGMSHRVEPGHVIASYMRVTLPLLCLGLTHIDGSLNTGCRQTLRGHRVHTCTFEWVPAITTHIHLYNHVLSISPYALVSKCALIREDTLIHQTLQWLFSWRLNIMLIQCDVLKSHWFDREY